MLPHISHYRIIDSRFCKCVIIYVVTSIIEGQAVHITPGRDSLFYLRNYIQWVLL
jgi:hypothetical protein